MRAASHIAWIERRITAVAVSAVVALFPPTSAGAEFSEYDVKALYIYHFTQFVTWPGQDAKAPDAPFVIGIVGKSPFGDNLRQIVDQHATPQGRSVEIREFPTVNDLSDCQILFVCQSENRTLGSILNAVGQSPVLTVGDSDSFALRGCIIGFEVESSRVRIVVNEKAAAKSGLELSSNLLRIAQAR